MEQEADDLQKAKWRCLGLDPGSLGGVSQEMFPASSSSLAFPPFSELVSLRAQAWHPLTQELISS